MAEENSQWLVDAFRGSSDYQDLYNQNWKSIKIEALL
jgi:hypothetical protein